MRPILFSIGSYQVPSFFFLITIAALVSTAYAVWIGRKNELKADVILDMGLIGFIGAVLGARIFHILVEAPDYYWEKPMRVLEFGRGGFVSWGGFLTIGLSFWIYFRIRKLAPLPYFDILCVAAPIIKFFLRLACLLIGCCYGRPTDLPWGITFHDPASTAHYFMGAIPLHPTQIYSMIHSVLLFLFINWFYRRRKFDGQTTCLLAIFWSLPRMVVEFFRADSDRGIYFGFLSTGMIVGFAVSLFFLGMYRYLAKKNRHVD
ncbi:MAG: prolipoprotein diacylglyceryl transferase [Deltaproteobacteria bacterium]|nr:prolipoprotein diacylglyceryl transferase [Deltaproteobacteria bacterium]